MADNADSSARPSGTPILAMAAGQTIVWAGLYYIFPALLIRWEGDLGWSKTELTAAFTAAVAVSALCSPLAGRLIDRGLGPAVLAGGAAIGGVLIGAIGLVDAPWQFFALWTAMGAAMAGCLYEPCFALVTRARGAAARRAITLITLMAGFAGTLSFPSAHALAELGGWRLATGVAAAAVLLLALPLIAWAARRLEAERMARGAPAEAAGGLPTEAGRPLLRRPSFWLLAVAFSMLALHHGVTINHLLPILEDRGLSAGLAVTAAAAIGPMQVAGRLAVFLAGRHVTSAVIMTACFLSVLAATCALIGAREVPWLIAVFVVLQGAGYGITNIMKPVVTREIMGERGFGAISGALALPYLGAFAAAALVGSLLWEIGGYPFALRAILALAAIGLAAFLVAQHRARR